MNLVEPGSPAESLIGRAKSLILRPVETWGVIDREPATVDGLYRSWAVPLAAVPAVCRAASDLMFGGIHLFGVRYQPSLAGTLGRAAVGYGLSLLSIYALALVVEALALPFGGVRSRTQALKLTAYSATAAWAAGVFLLLPQVGGLLAAFGGLYSLYLLYLGLPILMRSAPERTLTYFVAILCAAILIGVLAAGLTSCVAELGGPISL